MEQSDKIIWVEEETHRKIKVLSSMTGQSMKDIIKQLVKESVDASYNQAIKKEVEEDVVTH